MNKLDQRIKKIIDSANTLEQCDSLYNWIDRTTLNTDEKWFYKRIILQKTSKVFSKGDDKYNVRRKMAYKRKTKDEYHIITDYGYGKEVELVEETFREAKMRVREYKDNAQGLHTINIVKKRVRISDETR